MKPLVFAAFALALSMTSAASADTAVSPLDAAFPAMKIVASHNWEVKTSAIANWKAMSARFKQQEADCQPQAGCEKFKALVKSLEGLSPHQQLIAIGQDEKKIAYKEDILNDGKAEFWATPYETLSRASGDTEDYAIVAYYALRAAGLPAADLRLIAVKIKSLGNLGAAVLVVNEPDGPEILDNRLPMPMRASAVAGSYTPVLGVNEDGWWIYIKK